MRCVPRRLSTTVLLLGLLFVVSHAHGSAPRVPALVFDGPAAFDPLIAELRWIEAPALSAVAAWLELPEPGPPLTIVLAPEGSEMARATPRWVSGYARGDASTAVLFPSRVVRYPYDDLAELFLHEVTHLLAHRAGGGRETPRWFAEGVALHAARGWTLADRRYALAAGLTGGPGTLEELAAAFQGGPGATARAYSLSGFLVDELVEDEGSAIVASILARMRSGREFEAAFRDATGASVTAWSDGVWRRYRIWYRWVPFVTSGATLWILVTGLAVVAFLRRRQRDAAIEERWEEEERRARGAALRVVPPENPVGEAVDEAEPPEEPREWIH